MLAKTDEKINKAVFILKKMSTDEKLQEVARIREKALHDEASYIEDAIDKGRKEGREEGRKTLIFRMFETEQPINLIKQITGLSDDAISAYKSEFQKNT